jgi:hypothetical protein
VEPNQLRRFRYQLVNRFVSVLSFQPSAGSSERTSSMNRDSEIGLET